MMSSGMLRRVALVRTEVSEEPQILQDWITALQVCICCCIQIARRFVCLHGAESLTEKVFRERTSL
jgi:hypothetical protein